MHAARQLDLFATAGFAPPPAASAPPAPLISAPSIPPETLTDEALIAAIPRATRRTCHALTREAAHRRLAPAIPALVALARRFHGFGLTTAIAEQVAALRALAAINGPEAQAAIVALLSDGTIQGPALIDAVEVAAHLQARLPPETALPLLRHPDPEIRSGTAACARINRETATALIDLLQDLNPQVATRAAHALGRAGYTEAMPLLFRHLAEHPTVETIEAIAGIADEPAIVLLGRLARANPDLAAAALAALEEIDHPRAAAVLNGLNRRP